jgi:predicted ABC-type ATPase
MERERPEIFVLAGPNGAGKTTAAAVVLPERLGVDQFVNADLIARGLSPFAPDRMAFRAGRLMLERIHELRSRGESFGFETTLATRSYVRFLEDARASGYIVELVYLWLSSTDLALRRVRARVAQGGHDVPPSVIERRYHRGLRNLFALYLPLCNLWTIGDNSGDELITVAHGRRGEAATVVDAERWVAIRRAVDDPER